MFAKHLRRPLLLICLGLMTPLAAHSKAEHHEHHDTHKAGIIKLVQMAKAMGGLKKIMKIKGRQVVSTNSQFEPEQSFKPGGTPIHTVDYQNVLTHIFGKSMSRNEWTSNIFYPLVVDRSFTEIINGKHGAVLGVDSILGIPEAPMQSSRLGARSKHYLTSSPLALIQHAMASPKKVSYLGVKKIDGRRYHTVSIFALGHPINILIDPKSKLPAWIETLEDDSIYGDALWRIGLHDWQVVDDIRVPGQLTHYFNGTLIRTQHNNAISLLNEVDESLFVVPEALKQPLSDTLFDWGTRSSQYFARFLPMGIPFDLDQTTAATNTVVEVSPGVFHYRALTHNTLIVEMDDYLVAIDPPLYDERTQVVLNDVAQRFPDKPIKYIVASHFHSDHISGIRGYAAIGATIIVGTGTKSHYEEIFAAPHTVYPDAYALAPKPVSIITVSAGKPFIISDGKRNIHLVDIPNSHATGLLMPYIEDAKMAFVSDLYSPELFPAPLPAQFSFWTLDLFDALQELDLDIEYMVGAHGSVVSYEQFVSDVMLTRGDDE